MMSDAPAHHLFCLLGPTDKDSKKIPEILVVIQVCLEGQISERSVNETLSRGKKAAGDLIPWTITQQFGEPDFAKLSGARIVRIATHPDYQGVSIMIILYEFDYSERLFWNTIIPFVADGIWSKSIVFIATIL